METTSRKRSDLDALYAIRDEIAAIEECDRKIQDRQDLSGYARCYRRRKAGYSEYLQGNQLPAEEPARHC